MVGTNAIAAYKHRTEAYLIRVTNFTSAYSHKFLCRIPTMACNVYIHPNFKNSISLSQMKSSDVGDKVGVIP